MSMKKYEEWDANHKHDNPPREKIVKLGRKITDVADHIFGGVKVEDPEYWGLAEIISDEMADIALQMKKRTPYTFKEMCKLCKIEKNQEEAFQKLLDEMSYIGLLEYDYGYHYDHNGRTAPQSERRYILPMFVPGSAELFNMEELPDRSNPRVTNHPDVAAFFERMTYIPLAGITQMVPPGGVGRCSCRASRKAIGDGCADDDFGWCIGVGDFADYCRETGKGHDITKEEALAILKRAEDNGFVHQITNIDGENKIFGICNCNVEICNALRTSQLFNTPNMSRSAYVAHVEKDKCVACGRCVEYCPAGAVRLGQKLCKKDGSEIKYPKQELPDATKWGPEKYDFNYRDNNRINTHETGTAPCKSACPAHIAVQGYIKMASQGRYQDALALIKKQNPFPAVCGAICNRRCEDACTRGKVDEALSIDAIKRFIAEQDLNAQTRHIPEVVIPASIHMDHFDEKIAIIGAGPAGLTAAFYLAETGYRPTVFEKSEHPGGMLRYGIPSYKLEKDLLDAEIDVAKAMGVEIKTGIEVGKDVTIQQLREQGYKAFYIAIGCAAGRLPGLENENAEGVMTAIDYLHDANCGNAPFAGKVVVVGGGNVAIDASRVSARNAASSVFQFSLEQEPDMPASVEEIKEAREDGVTINCGWGPKEILAENGKVTGIVFKKCLSVINDGKFAPVYDENETMTVECGRLIFAIGQQSVWKDLLKGEDVKFNGPAIELNQVTFQSSKEDIFAGGDVYTGPKFAIDAIAQGKIAAESLHRYVHNGHMETGRNRWQFKPLDTDDILVESYDRGPKQVEGINLEVKDRFKDNTQILTEEQIKKETARCLGCGATIVDTNKCIGCGVCTTKCEFDAIKLHRDHPECSNMVVAEDKFKAIIPYQLKRVKNIILKKKVEH